MKITFAKPELPGEGSLVVGVLDGRVFTPTAEQLDEITGGALTRAMKASRFEGKKDQMLEVVAPQGTELSRILLAGLGKAEEIDALQAQNLGGSAVSRLGKAGNDKALSIAVDAIEGCPLSPAEFAAQAGFGARLGSYRFDKYRTKEKKEDKPSLKKTVLLVAEHAEAKKQYQPLDAIADGVFFTRDLVSEPANVIYPETLAREAEKLGDLGVEVEVYGEKQLRKMGFGALLAVGQGSERESQLVVMRWKGAKNDEAPVAFVGKGVTFDSGGISIKPAANMEDMKWDMGGAGVVVGLMRSLAARKAKVNAVGVVGLVENMPSGSAQRPGDVVTTLSGQTVEVINTDAEGRLVLADALWYTQDRFKPRFMVDLATLTGAILIALGDQHAGLFTNNDELAERIAQAGEGVGEKVWRFPLGDAYDKQLKSDIADMKNVGGREAGSITAAQFLQRFVNDVPWAHIDIAGVTWSKKEQPTVPKGATAFGVRLLNRLLTDHYEEG